MTYQHLVYFGVLLLVGVEALTPNKMVIRARRQFACGPPLYCSPVLQAPPACVCTPVQQDPCCQALYQPIVPIPLATPPLPPPQPACICAQSVQQAPPCCPPVQAYQPPPIQPPPIQPPPIQQAPPCCIPVQADPCCQPIQPPPPQQNPLPPPVQQDQCCCCIPAQPIQPPPQQNPLPPQDAPLSCTCVQVTIKQTQPPVVPPPPQQTPPLEQPPCVCCVPVQQSQPCRPIQSPPISQQQPFQQIPPYQQQSFDPCCQPIQQNPIPQQPLQQPIQQAPIQQQSPCVCVTVNRDACCNVPLTSQPGQQQQFNNPPPNNQQFNNQNRNFGLPDPQPINPQLNGQSSYGNQQLNGVPNLPLNQQNNGPSNSQYQSQGQFGPQQDYPQQPRPSTNLYDQPSLYNSLYGSGSRASPTPPPQQRIQTLQYPPPGGSSSTQRPLGYNPQQQSAASNGVDPNQSQFQQQRPNAYTGPQSQQQFGSPYQQQLPELRPSIRRQPPSMTQAVANCACNKQRHQQRPCKC